MVMTSSNEFTGKAVQDQPEFAPSKIVELLDRLGKGEHLVDVPLAMGLSQEQARAIFLCVAEIVRQNFKEPSLDGPRPVKGVILDWSKMTVAEALEILSDRAAKRPQREFGSSMELAPHDKAGIAADPDAL
jgi:hypothetical protein